MTLCVCGLELETSESGGELMWRQQVEGSGCGICSLLYRPVCSS